MTPLNRLSRLLDYLAQDPRNPRLLSDVADAQLQLGDWAAAKSTLQQQLALQPGDPFARYQWAVAERASGDAAAAVALLQALMAEGHAPPAVLQELARSQAQQGDWAAVPPTLVSLDADQLPPDEGDAVRLLRIRAHHRLGALDEALAEARAWQGARGGALPLQGLAAMATLLLDAERIDEAAALLAQVDAETAAGNAELAAAIGFVALSRGQAEAAAQHFDRSAELQPQFGRALLGQGLASAQRGDATTAIDRLRAAVAAAPSQLGGWHALAWMQLLQRDIDGAAASFREALAQDDNFGESHGGLALIAALRGDRETSARHMRTATRLDPHSTNVMVTQLVLERGPGALDADLLKQALDRFTGLAAARHPALRRLLARTSKG